MAFHSMDAMAEPTGMYSRRAYAGKQKWLLERQYFRSSKLLQKTQIIFKEQAQIVYAVTQHC